MKKQNIILLVILFLFCNVLLSASFSTNKIVAEDNRSRSVEVDCSICGGTEKVPCTNVLCDEFGKCTVCNGNGMIESNCTVCGGGGMIGSELCDKCSAGRVTTMCDKCSMGYCKYCLGQKTVSCTGCIGGKVIGIGFLITLNPNGITPNEEIIQPDAFANGASFNNFPTLTATGYDFIGWNTSSAATTAQYTSGSPYTVTADETFYGVWKQQHIYREILFDKTLDNTVTDASLSTGNYYLTEDVEVSSLTIQENANVKIDLNGFELKITTDKCYVKDGSSLSIYDSSSNKTGILSRNSVLPKSAIDVSSNATLNLYEGTISFASSDLYSGIKAIWSASTINIYDGKISAGSMISVSGSTSSLNMYGGTIEGVDNEREHSSIVYIQSGATINLNADASIVSNGRRVALAIYSANGEIKGTVKNNATYDSKVTSPIKYSALQVTGTSSPNIYNSAVIKSTNGVSDVTVSPSSFNPTITVAETLSKTTFSKIRVYYGNDLKPTTSNPIIKNFKVTNPSDDFGDFFVAAGFSTYAWFTQDATSGNLVYNYWKITKQPTDAEPKIETNRDDVTYVWKEVTEEENELTVSDLSGYYSINGSAKTDAIYDSTNNTFKAANLFGFSVIDSAYVSMDLIIVKGTCSGNVDERHGQANLSFYSSKPFEAVVRVGGVEITGTSQTFISSGSGSYSTEKQKWVAEYSYGFEGYAIDLWVNANDQTPYEIDFEGNYNLYTFSTISTDPENPTYFQPYYTFTNCEYKLYGKKRLYSAAIANETKDTLSNLDSGKYICYVTSNGVTLASDIFEHTKYTEWKTKEDTDYVKFTNPLDSSSDLSMLSSGNYYLAEDIEVSSLTIQNNSNIKIDLNGCELKVDSQISVKKGASLSFYDSSSTKDGAVTQASTATSNDHFMKLTQDSTVNLYEGTFTSYRSITNEYNWAVVGYNISLNIYGGKYKCYGPFLDFYGNGNHANIYSGTIEGLIGGSENTQVQVIRCASGADLLIDTDAIIKQNRPHLAVNLYDSNEATIKGKITNEALNPDNKCDPKSYSGLYCTGTNSIKIYNSTSIKSVNGNTDVALGSDSWDLSLLSVQEKLTSSFGKMRIFVGCNNEEEDAVAVENFGVTNPTDDFNNFFIASYKNAYAWLTQDETTKDIKYNVFKITEQPTTDNPEVSVNVEGATYTWKLITETTNELKNSDIIVLQDNGTVSTVTYDATKGCYVVEGKIAYYLPNNNNLYSLKCICYKGERVGIIALDEYEEYNIFLYTSNGGEYKIKVDGSYITNGYQYIYTDDSCSFDSTKGSWVGDGIDIYFKSDANNLPYVIEFEGEHKAIYDLEDDICTSIDDVEFSEKFSSGLYKFIGLTKTYTETNIKKAKLSDVSSGKYICYITYKGTTVVTDEFDYVKKHEHGSVETFDYINYDNEILDLEDFMSMENGCYELECDVTLTEDFVVPANKAIRICLNGHTINLGGHTIICNGSLYIDDCNETNITYLSYDETNKVYSISSTETEYSVKGGIIMNGGDVAIDAVHYFNINGGNLILNNTAVKTYYGMTYNFNDGQISYNKKGVFVAEEWFVYLNGKVNISNNIDYNLYLDKDASISIDTGFNGKISITSKNSNYMFGCSEYDTFESYLSSDSTDVLIVVESDGEEYPTYSYYVYDKCSVTYDDNVSNETITVPKDETTYHYGEYVTISTSKPERDGYIFKGWATSKTATSALTDTKVQLEDDVTFYAVWEKKDDNTISNFTITNINCGGTLSPSASALVGTVTFTYSTSESGTYTSTVPTEAGTYYIKATSTTDDTYQGLSETKSFTILHNHEYKEFAWTNFTAKAVYECSCGDKVSHDATVTSAITTNVTCLDKGVRTYTATYEGHTDTKTEEIAKLGHNYEFIEFSWFGYTAQAIYKCSHDESHTETHDATISYTITKAPTCEAKGLKTYTASYEGHTSNKTEDIAKLNHYYIVTYEWTTDYKCTKVQTCMNDSSHVIRTNCQVKVVVESGSRSYIPYVDGNPILTEAKVVSGSNEELVKDETKSNSTTVDVIDLIRGTLETTVKVVVNDKDTEVAQAIKESIKEKASKKHEVVAKFDIHLEDQNGNVVPNQDGNAYIVTLNIPTGFKSLKDMKVICINDDDTVEVYEVQANEDGSISFETTHFSSWAIIANTSLFPWWAIVLIVLGSLIVIFVGLFFIWKAEYDKAINNNEEDERKLMFLDTVYKPINDLLFNKKQTE